MIRRVSDISGPPDLTVSPELFEERRQVRNELAGSLSNDEADRIEAILKDMFGRPDAERAPLDRPCD